MSGDDQPNDPAKRQTGRTRGADGKFARTAETAERDALAATYRGRGWSYRRIAAEMSYSSPASAYEAVRRALAEITEEPAAEVRRLELERLDHLYTATLGVLERKHITVNNGKVIQLPDPETGELEPLEDDAPILQAVDRLLKIQERRARYLGLDSPQRLSVDAENLGQEIAALLEAAGADRDDSPGP